MFDLTTQRVLFVLEALGLSDIRSRVDSLAVGGSPTWGSITGTLSSQTDLNTALSGKAATAHAHATTDITGLQENVEDTVANMVRDGLNTTWTYNDAAGTLTLDAIPIWGGIGGTLASQTDLNTALNGKQATLVSGTNIKTINSTSLLGSGNISISGSVADGDKGDIVVSGTGATWTIDAGVVTTTKMGGDVTAAGKALLDDADAAAQRTTLDVMQGEIFKILNADEAATNGSSAQPWFPTAGGATLAAGTYLFEGLLILSNGATSHTTALGFGGTAVLDDIFYVSNMTSVNVNTASTTQHTTFVNAATATVVNATSTALFAAVHVRGVVRVGTAGTLIPQFTWSAAPGGTNLVKRETFFRLSPVGANNVTSRGTWS